MSEDPETARQIAELSLDTRPLLVLDVDDVLIEFLRPFIRYLNGQGLDLSLATFRLLGNVSRRTTRELLDQESVSALVDSFFGAQRDWQSPLRGAPDAIAGLARDAEIVMLTSMPHRHRSIRRTLLDHFGFRYPLVTTETAKGPAIQALRGMSDRPIAFVDDMPHNLASARASVADAHLFHLMAMPEFRPLLPQLPERAEIVDEWRDAAERIAAALRI